MNNFEMPMPTIYTIGHSNVPASKIVELLIKFEIKMVADVRSSPYSQYVPQFNREIFEHTLYLAGIAYKYAGEALGGRPKDPACYKNGELPEGKADYLHLVDYPGVMARSFFQKGIERLLYLGRESRTALLCSEEDPAECHRHHMLGKYLVSLGVEVRHIRADGTLVRDQQLPNLASDPPAEQLSLF
jgi:uncharacterized protein (DUF488 family)